MIIDIGSPKTLIPNTFLVGSLSSTMLNISTQVTPDLSRLLTAYRILRIIYQRKYRHLS